MNSGKLTTRILYKTLSSDEARRRLYSTNSPPPLQNGHQADVTPLVTLTFGD